LPFQEKIRLPCIRLHVHSVSPENMKTSFSILTLILSVSLALSAAEPAALYTAVSGEPVWLEADVLQLHPDAVIVRTGNYEETAAGFSVPADQSSAKTEIWIERKGDWIEPITPPDKSGLPSVASNEMKVLELRGTAQVFLPGTDAPVVAAEGMLLPEGARLRTEAGGSAAVFLGGVNSVRLAPETDARLSQKIGGGRRQTLIDLRSGAVFSKVGRRPGEIQQFGVRTPLGIAAARGTDFVTVQLPNRMDVWIAEGRVQLDDLQGNKIGEVASDGSTQLQIIRMPAEKDPVATAQANSLTMGAAISLIPTINAKVNALRARAATGEMLTTEETAYLARIRQITWLIKARKAEAAPMPVAPSPAATETMP
jgi:hypothetical protein